MKALFLLLFSGLKWGKLAASGGSMLLSLVVYATIWGWRYAAGFIALLMLCFRSAARQPRLAIAWVAAILGCVSMIGGLKLVLDVCGDPLAGTGLTSPSGHVAVSTVVYGGIAAAISASLAPPVRTALIANTTALLIRRPGEQEQARHLAVDVRPLLSPPLPLEGFGEALNRVRAGQGIKTHVRPS